jgi:hypothetical protein
VIYVLPGTQQQYQNFRHAFGDHFRQILHKQDLMEAQESQGRTVVLLIGTWYNSPLRDEVLNWCNSKDADGRPRGQAFAKMGPGANK